MPVLILALIVLGILHLTEHHIALIIFIIASVIIWTGYGAKLAEVLW